jgi:CheY-like chemotaxis protein
MIQSVCVQDPPTGEHATLPKSQKTILIVDDERPILNMLREILVDLGGYDVLVAPSCREALLLAAGQEEPPHLLLLDYALFGSALNGIELYDLLHEREGWQGIPAIIASCNAPEHEVHLRGLGLLSKPFALEKLLSMVADALAPLASR